MHAASESFGELKTGLIDEIRARPSDPLTLWGMNRQWVLLQVIPSSTIPVVSSELWAICRQCFLSVGVDDLWLSASPWDMYLVFTPHEMGVVTHQELCDKCRRGRWVIFEEAP